MSTSRTKKGGGLAALAKGLDSLAKVSRDGDLEIGIFGDARHRSRGAPKLAQLLAWHEFGTPTIPARRPVQTYMAKDGPKDIAERAAKVLPPVLRGEAEAPDALEAIGLVAVVGIRKTIAGRLPPPLAESTKANPKRDPRHIPLLDTGQLSKAITVRIGGRVLKRL